METAFDFCVLLLLLEYSEKLEKMDINDANLDALANHLRQTLAPDVAIRKPAEHFLMSVETNTNYAILLLNLIARENVDLTVRVAGAITFKNFVKRNWKIEEDERDKIDLKDRNAVKQLIVNLMVKSPEVIQRQLSDAISVIGREDFPEKWPNLLGELVEKFGTGDLSVINGILQTAHSLFKRYRYEFKSDKLWKEIKFVLDNFAEPLTQLLIALMGLTKQYANDNNAQKVVYNSVLLVMKIFSSLNCQDLPEYFEDNMQVWMQTFENLLETNVPALQSATDEEAGVMEQIKSQICENIGMYAQKYDEEFYKYLPVFVKSVWNLLVSTSLQSKYDSLVSNAIKFLAIVADKDKNKEIFAESNTLSQICQNVIIPSMEFRESDEELFEDNPEEYIRRDIEGSDLDTRRRAACDLIRSLSRHFEQQMTTVFGQYVQVMLTKYAENPAQNWKNKDVAIYLVTSLAAKGQTQKQGITKTNQLVNVTDFYQSHVLCDLASDNISELPVLKADAIKYVMIFRNQLPPAVVKQTFPYLIKLVKSENPVVHTYAACAIEKILLVKQADNFAMVRSEDLATVAQDLLSNLFGALALPASKENDHVMKAIMRSLSTLQTAIVPFAGQLISQLTNILVLVARNPSKPHFNHYLFESLSLVVRYVCKQNPQAVSDFEVALFPIFQQILQQDVAEFIPYVFQIFALTLDFNPNGISEAYMSLFPFLLAPVLWDKQGNIHPLVRLLRSYISKGSQLIVQTGKLGAILGVFQKLIASKVNDHEGFLLIQSVVEHMSPEAIHPSITDVFRLLFQRLQSSKTVKFSKNLITFFCFYVIKFGAPAFIQVIASIQENMFAMVLDRIMIPDLQKISDPKDKKICAVGVTKILCEAPDTFSGAYRNYWGTLLQSLIGLFELPEESADVEDEHFAEIDESAGYQAAYSHLAFSGKDESDILKGQIPDVKLYLAASLHSLSIANPGEVGTVIATIARPAQDYLTKYLQVANIQLV
ncbi:unnamed protein product [Allacma fusca]|uniref:Exportin-2 n=1 Tax=Allacma fusca TaxID=39272 RepID=A0A8J2NIA7_9HEXA|nr:unnamed protein product [Allacma fusca]